MSILSVSVRRLDYLKIMGVHPGYFQMIRHSMRFVNIVILDNNGVLVLNDNLNNIMRITPDLGEFMFMRSFAGPDKFFPAIGEDNLARQETF